MTVSNLDEALGFWESFLGIPARWRTLLDRPYLAVHTGYPGIHIAAASLDLPGGCLLELLDYQLEDRQPLPEHSFSPGHVHLCLEVADARTAWTRAVASGARPVVNDGPVVVEGGPNAGALIAYLRIHDGITLELLQPPERRGDPCEEPAG